MRHECLNPDQLKIVLNDLFHGDKRTFVYLQHLNEYCKLRYKKNLAKATNVFHRCLLEMKKQNLRGSRLVEFYQDKGAAGGTAWILSKMSGVKYKIVEKRVREIDQLKGMLDG